MNEGLILFLCGVAGAGLGSIFFLGLWWTIRKCVSSGNPAVLFLASLLIRTGTVVVGFYYLSQGQWPRLLCGLLGFIVARQVVTKWIQREAGNAVNS